MPRRRSCRSCCLPACPDQRRAPPSGGRTVRRPACCCLPRRIRPPTPAVPAAATDLLLCLESAPRRFALLLRLEVPDGWRLDVSAGEIPLASRRLSDSSLLLLLDGQTASASPVLARLTVTRPPGASGCVRVLPNPDDPSIYYWKAPSLPLRRRSSSDIRKSGPPLLPVFLTLFSSLAPSPSCTPKGV